MRTLLLFLLGTSLGSFFGLIIDRFPNRSLIFPRSHCQTCQTPLNYYDLCPILSQMVSHFRCRYCQVKLPYWYAILEFSCGIILVFWDWELLSNGQTYFLLLSLILSIYDLKEQAYPLLIWLIPSLPIFFLFDINLLTLVFLVLALIAERIPIKMGSGDFLYLTSMSLLAETFHVFWSIQLACLNAIIYLLLTDRKKSIAFVPFLTLGYILILLYPF